jgi:8-oxo-dGTP pyrophosphatase MutT (NUDIX family)
MRAGRVLISAEYIADVFCWKFPGGGVEHGESAEQALAREFMEETGLEISIGRLLHDPGTLFSPWSKAHYTPRYFAVEAEGEPVVPDHEPVEMSFKDPRDAVASGLMADPETHVLTALLGEGAT